MGKTRILESSNTKHDAKAIISSKKSSNFWGRIAVVSTALAPIITLISIGLLTWQTNLLSDQVGIDSATQRATTRSADMRFLSAIHIDISSSNITIKNRSELALSNSELWLLERYDGKENVNEILSEVRGVPACSELTINRNRLASAINANQDTNPKYVTPENADYEVNYVTQAPSGAWYLVANSGRIDRIDYQNLATEDNRGDWYDYDSTNPMQALKSSQLYEISADTYWEGYNNVSVYHAPTISGGDSITGGPFNASIQLLEC